MASYVVKSATKTADKPDKGYGLMQEIALVLQEYGQSVETAAAWYTRRTTALPEAGSKIEGDVTPSEFGLKFKKAQAPGYAGGGPRGRSPEEIRRIVRQHSQTTALRYAEFAHLRGTLPEEFKFADMKKLIDWFHADAMEGGQT